MCRQSANNKYKKCYLKKPQLYTIPEEVGEGVIMFRIACPSSAAQPYSPKGIKRLMNNSFAAAKSPRVTKSLKNKDNVFFGDVTSPPPLPTAPRGPINIKKLHLVTSAHVTSMGEHSPRCRRVSKFDKNRPDFQSGGGGDDIAIDLSDKVCSASPRTLKRVLVAGSTLGNQSPPCRRVPREQDANIQKTLAQTGAGSPKIVNRMLSPVKSDVGNHSPPCRRASKGEDMCIGSIVWTGSGTIAKSAEQSKEKKNNKERSLFKKVVKFLTVPKEDFLAT